MLKIVRIDVLAQKLTKVCILSVELYGNVNNDRLLKKEEWE